MPCNQTSYPHGTLPAGKTYRFGETAESECSSVCRFAGTGGGAALKETAAAAVAECDNFINGIPVESTVVQSGVQINEFDYVGANMICSPCQALIYGDEQSIGYSWRVGIEYCCIDGLYVGPDGASGPC